MHNQVIYLEVDFLNILKYQLTDVLRMFVRVRLIIVMFQLTEYGLLEGKQAGIMETGFGNSEVF